ncbi:MAG: type VI secretion system tip protein VgrG, partial [Pseudomonadales bacterium]|nr:type VI secretion system tip protein VgrG [Pseudomonadales bacterium]
AVVTLLGDEPTPTKRLVHGFISKASYLSSGNRFSLYKITLTPQLSYFKYRSGHRIFQNMSVQGIIKQLFSDAKIPTDQIQWKLKKSYPTKEYCVQYDETEFTFISRLLAEVGIHYHFTHHLDRHVIVFSDNNTAFIASENNPTLPYIQEQSRAHGETSAYQFELTRKATPNNANLLDFSFTSPNNALIAKTTNGQGKQYVEDHLSQLQHLKEHAIAHTNSLLMSGTRFALSGAKNKSWNQDYFVFHILHEGKQPQSLEEYASAQPCTYTNRITCVPVPIPPPAPASTPQSAKPAAPGPAPTPAAAETPTDQYQRVDVNFPWIMYRPGRKELTKPDAQGVTPAIVTGPAGEEIYTDEYGRVKVQFPWDREGSGNETSSCWLRVKQGWAGIEYGSNTIPRIGQEVIVSYENADPDRPLVTGRVYNGKNKTPYALPAHKTRTALKTQSSLKGDGYNEFRIEDKKGQEQLFIHGEKDMDLHIKKDKKTLIQNNHHTTVGGSHYQQQNQLHQTIGGANNEKVGKQLSLTVSKDITIKISGAKAVQAGNALFIKSGMKAVLDAGQQLVLKAGAGTIALDPSGVSITGPIVAINEGGGGGVAIPAFPMPPAPPVEADKNKAGQSFKSSSTGVPQLPPSDADIKQAAAQAINFRMASKTRAPVVSIPAPPSKKSTQAATQPNPTTNTSKPSASEIVPPTLLPQTPITNTDVKDWLQLQLLWDDKHKTPVKNQPYTLYLADGSFRKGILDTKGQAFEENLPKGTVKVEYTTEDAEVAKLKQLKAQFGTALKNIIAVTQHDTDMQQMVADDMSPQEMNLVILGAAFMGTWDFASDMASFVAMVSKALYKTEMAYLDLLLDIQTGNIREVQRKYEVAQAAGAASYEVAGDVAEAINLLMRDEETWDLLTDFPGDYWDALSAVDATRQLAPLVIDILITIFSLGVGAPLLAANISTKAGKLITRAGELLAEIVKGLKKAGQTMKKNATSNSIVAAKIRNEVGRSKKPKRSTSLEGRRGIPPTSLNDATNRLKTMRTEIPVSYTHLTLPTTSRV